MEKPKVLILKIGYSEVLDDRNNSRKVSLGDVLRTTPILEKYRGAQVTWVTDSEAFPLLENNPLIHKLLPYDFTTAFQLQAEEFDTVINLEKIPGICALAEKIKARRNRYGFIFNSQTGEAEALDSAYEVLAVSSNPIAKKNNKRTFQELLFEMIGEKWNGEEYILGYKPKTQEQYDVALNTQVGQKWPTKSWSRENWDKLEELLVSSGLKVTRQDKQDQKVLKDLNFYMDWLNSSKIIISNDSLGLHIGIALRKKVYGLFGPTPNSEVYFYNRGKAILPPNTQDCMPCFSPICTKDTPCINFITPKQILEEIQNDQ